MSKSHLGSKYCVVGSTSQSWECGFLNLCTNVSDNPAASLWQAWLQPSARGQCLARTAEYWEKQNVIVPLPSLADLNCWKTGVSVSGVCSQGSPWVAKGCEAAVIAWEWKGSFRNSDCQHGPPIYRVMQAAAELALRPLLPIFCPASLHPVAGRP